MQPKSPAGRPNIFVGRTGEELALEHLVKKKYKIIACNVRTPFGEIDIVALNRNTLIFVEVKTRTQEEFGPPHASITEYKKRHIIMNALYYMKKKRVLDHPARIDVVSIYMASQDTPPIIEHIESAIWIGE